MHKQFVVLIEDLRFVTILCSHCNTKVTLDLAIEFPPPRSRFYFPRECPRCQSAFDSAIPGNIEAMQKVYTALAALGNTVSFTPGSPVVERDAPQGQ